MSIKFSDHVVAEKFLQMADDVSATKTLVEEMKTRSVETEKLVNKHETAYTVGKWATAPALISFHVGLRHILNKLGL